MAHWIIEDKGFGGQVFQCSNCGESWNDIFHSGVGCWDKCPSCGEEMEEEKEYMEEKLVENPLKKISDAVGKLQIPPLHINWVKEEVKVARERDEKIQKFEKLTGMTIDELYEKLAAGWVLSPPPTTYSMSSPNYKFDTELLKRQIEEFEKKRYSEWPYWGRCEFEKRRGEESIKDMMRRAGCFGEKLIYEPLVVNIDFDKRPEENESEE